MEDATEFEIYEAKEKLRYAWKDMFNSFTNISTRLDALESTIDKLTVTLDETHDAFVKKILNLDADEDRTKCMEAE